MPRVEGKTVVVPLDGYSATLRLNFRNRRYWRRTLLRDLLGRETEAHAYVRPSGRDCLARPIDQRYMLQISVRHPGALAEFWAEQLGFSEYLDYVDDRMTAELKRRAEELKGVRKRRRFQSARKVPFRCHGSARLSGPRTRAPRRSEPEAREGLPV